MSDQFKVNIGSGDKKMPGVINLDLRVLPKTDLGGTVASLPFANNSIEAIICSDVLEHVPRHQLMAVLFEIHRVLKPNGYVKIKMPNLRALATAYVEGKIDCKEFSRKIYGNQESGNPANFHKSGLDPETLSASLKIIGFSNVQVVVLDGNEFGNMGCRAHK